MCVCVCVCVCVTCVSCNYPQDDISDRRSPLSVAVTISPLERQPRKVNGSQDIIDLRDIPILNVLPQNNVKQEVHIHVYTHVHVQFLSQHVHACTLCISVHCTCV